MKNILVKIATMVLYLMVLLWLVDFRLLILFNLKYIIIVILGSVILTVSSYKKGMDQEAIIAVAKWNTQITGFLTTFMLQFAYLSGGANTKNLMYEVAMNCRPLMYAAIIYIVINGLSDRKPVLPIREIANANAEELVDWKSLGLTSREITIVEKMIADFSNKEIGEQLFISESTVKKHISNIFKKLEISNREQLKHKKSP